MKKILYLLLASIFVLPLGVKADRDLNGEILLYSEQTSVGSDIVFRVTSNCDNNTCDGMIEYNPDVLEFKSINYNYPLIDVGPSNGSVTVISNENGTLKYDYNDPDITANYMRTSIIATFTVKTAPSSGSIEINYTPLNGTEPIESLKVKKEIKTSEVSTSCNCPICDNDNQNKDESTECNCSKEKECKNDNTWFIIGIVSLIFNALLLIVLLLTSKKKSNNVVKEEVKEEEKPSQDNSNPDNNQ